MQNFSSSDDLRTSSQVNVAPINNIDINELSEIFEAEKLKKHQLSELFESRINDGVDTVNKHPVFAPQIAEKARNIVKTSDEKYRYDNYQMFNPQMKIPAFWEPRVWDNKEDIMTEEETQNVIQQNLDYQKPIPKSEFHFQDRDFSESIICPKPIRREDDQKPHRIALSLLEFYTDGSETDTEIT